MIAEERRAIYCVGRTIYIFDDIDNDSVCTIIKMIQDLEQKSKDEPIQLIINSEGGYVYDGLALYDKLRNSPCEIQAIGTGIVASIAVIVYLAANKRYLTDTARIMYHKASAMLSGNSTEIQIEAKEIETLEKITNCIVAERTGQSLRKIQNDIKNGNYYMSAEEAITDGYVTKIIPNKKYKTKIRRTRKRVQR